MQQLLKNIDPNNIPQHVAIIMDGNGRWAKQKGKIRIFGHRTAIKAVRQTVECAAEIGIKYLTLYAFSTENWNRPVKEVNALMDLLVNSLKKELPTLNKNEIRLVSIGDRSKLPKDCDAKLQETIEATKNNGHMTLNLALSYSARWEILEAIQSLVEKVKLGTLNPEDISEEVLSNHLCTAGMPDPELMIRTSGEHRISNFLLWQLAYSELYFTDVLWPDFKKENLVEAILDYQSRERRFGLTGEQVSQ